jgi:hypothetical protein
MIGLLIEHYKARPIHILELTLSILERSFFFAIIIRVVVLSVNKKSFDGFVKLLDLDFGIRHKPVLRRVGSSQQILRRLTHLYHSILSMNLHLLRDQNIGPIEIVSNDFGTNNSSDYFALRMRE